MRRSQAIDGHPFQGDRVSASTQAHSQAIKPPTRGDPRLDLGIHAPLPAARSTVATMLPDRRETGR